MNYKQLIVDSWRSTQNDKRTIFWLGFIPAILTTTVGVGTIAYQFFAFKRSFLFEDAEHGFLEEVLTMIWEFITSHVSWTLPLVIFAIIFGILYFIVPTLAKASAIQSIARKRNGQKSGVGVGIRYGIMSFLPLFEYHLLIKTFAFFSVLFEMSFVVRNLGIGIFEMFLPFFILFIFISLLLLLLFTYADLYIVIDDVGVFKSMKNSAKLVVLNWKHTFLISILMILIGIRIVIQVILVFLIPFLIVLITGYIATVALPVTGVLIGGFVGFIGLLLASYLNGVVDIFSYTVWTHTFLDITAEKELSARDVFVDDIPEAKTHQSHKNLTGSTEHKEE